MAKFKQRIWSKDEVRQLQSLAKQKMPASAIARRLRRSLDSVKKKASNLRTPLGATTRWSDADLRKLKALAQKKQSVEKIAKALGRTVSATEKMASNHRISLDMRG